MPGKLPGRDDFFRSLDFDLRVVRQLLFCNRAATQNANRTFADCNNSGLDAESSRPGVDNQRNPRTQFIEDMSRCRRANPAKSVALGTASGRPNARITSANV